MRISSDLLFLSLSLPLKTRLLCFNSPEDYFAIIVVGLADMEKHKEENLPSPDTVLGDYLRNSESETESSKASTSELETLKDPKPPASSSSSWWWFEFLHLFKSNKSKKSHNKFSSSISMREEQISDLPNPPMVDVGLNYFRPQWKNFTLSDLQTATNNFCKG